jgi:hypothetical protein
MGTFGFITIDSAPSRRWWTVERPWKDNKPGESCIPLGIYKLRHGTYTANGTRPPYPDLEFVDVPGRKNIEIHCANYARELKGCIAPGRVLRLQAWAIGESRHALNELLAEINGDPDIEIEIRRA